MRFSIRAILIFTALIAILLGVAFELNRRLENYFLNPYRLQATGDILIEYLEARRDWPADWDDLQRFVETSGNNLFGVRTFCELRENITIDFSFDPSSIKFPCEEDANAYPLRVVIAADGRCNGATHDPNTTILRYLEQNQKRLEYE